MKAFYFQPDGKDNGCTANASCSALPCGTSCDDTELGGGWFQCPHRACSANHYHTSPACYYMNLNPPGAVPVLNGIRIESGLELVLRAPHANPDDTETYLDYVGNAPYSNIQLASGAGIAGQIINDPENGQPEWRFIPDDVKSPGDSPSSMKLRSEGSHGSRYLRVVNGWVVADGNTDNAAVFDIQVVSEIGIQLQVNGNAVYATPAGDGSSFYLRADGASPDAVTFWAIVVGLPKRS